MFAEVRDNMPRPSSPLRRIGAALPVASSMPDELAERAVGLLRCCFSREQLRKTQIWTDGGLQIYGYDGKGERQRRFQGDGEPKGTVTDAISSPPPSKGETPVIM